MDYLFDAACSSCIGKGLQINGDNFFFDGKCLPEDHGSLPHPVTILTPLHKEQCVAVFGGVGEESLGKKASFAAADCLREQTKMLSEYVIPERHFLLDASQKISEIVLQCIQKSDADLFGTSMSALLFSHGFVYICSLGDCRAYRLRDGEFHQLFFDCFDQVGRKGDLSLTQFFGAPSEDNNRPYIAKGELKHGDQYLLFTGGMKDILSNVEIAGVLENTARAEESVQRLINIALDRGCQKSMTVILIRIH